MKKKVFLLALLLPFYGKSQISVQAYAGNKETELLGIYSKDFNQKWNYFASGTISYDYDTKKVNPEVYQNVNYGIGKNWGGLGGGSYFKRRYNAICRIGLRKRK